MLRDGYDYGFGVDVYHMHVKTAYHMHDKVIFAYQNHEFFVFIWRIIYSIYMRPGSQSDLTKCVLRKLQ